MDWVDVVLVVAMVAAAVHGLRLGALVQVSTFGGFWLGLTVGALLSVAVGGSIHSAPARAAVALALVLGLACTLGAAGRVVGGWTNVVLRRHHLGPADAALGVGVAVVSLLLSLWLIANVVSSSRYRWLSAAVQRSDILRAVDDVLPPVPWVFAHVQSFLTAEGFPPVFVDLSPPPAGPVAVPSISGAARFSASAAASTVKVLGVACGNQQEGSGFVAAPGLVVTNAHVVAGETDTRVVVGSTAYRATPVLFDPRFDLSVLRTSAPLGPPLPISPGDVGRGTQGAVLGYPENGPLTVAPAGVTAELTAQGRDIYDRGLVVRKVYELQADVEPGNSGGPLVATDGEVVGVVFSRSVTDPKVGYALASPGVLSRVEKAEGRERAVGTGACTQE